MKEIIRVENLSKAYRIGQKQQSHDTLFGKMADMVKAPFRNLKNLRSLTRFDGAEDPTVHWALKDIDFTVNEGEVLGIIGHNGAGKSTLLKILSRVTEPTTGRITIHGRVGALLEVGTGFHPELTGRENIYMNGTILGMTKKEIDRKLDEIVDFSGVEKYIDTPVKFYSSGMKVRLGFAVAAHLDPEILIIDEVLAVGDVEFQRKCLGKMEDVSRSGRTVLFVSHNMGAVRSLCKRGMVLDHGKIQFLGGVDDAVGHYVSSLSLKLQDSFEWDIRHAPGDERFKLTRLTVKPSKGDLITVSSGITIESECINYVFENALLDMSFELTNGEGVKLIHHGGLFCDRNKLRPGCYRIRAHIPPRLLNKGIYNVKVWFGLNMKENLLGTKPVITFEVLNDHVDHIVRELPGLLRPEIAYETSYCNEIKDSALVV